MYRMWFASGFLPKNSVKHDDFFSSASCHHQVGSFCTWLFVFYCLNANIEQQMARLNARAVVKLAVPPEQVLPDNTKAKAYATKAYKCRGPKKHNLNFLFNSPTQNWKLCFREENIALICLVIFFKLTYFIFSWSSFPWHQPCNF